MTRRKRKERKEIEVNFNNQPFSQVNSMKYLCITLDSKPTFREHINYMAEKYTKLILALLKSAKLSWGLKHAAVKQYTQEDFYLSSYTEHWFGGKP
jgi:hypothetical protein